MTMYWSSDTISIAYDPETATTHADPAERG